MKALIFAAGLGTRLKPLTDTMPKALVEVAGKPMLEHVILHLKEQGFTDIVVNIHYLGEQIIEFLKAHDNFGVNICISDEREEVLETGGGILKAADLLDDGEPFLVHNSDILTDIDLRQLYQKHLENEADATLLVSQRETSRYLLFDEARSLCGWLNKKNGEVLPEGFCYDPALHEAWAFNGVHIISPTLLSYMREDGWNGKFSIIPFYLSVCRKARIIASPIEAGHYWFDIGKMETLEEANKFFENYDFFNYKL